MFAELVRTAASDDLQLDGALHEPATGVASGLKWDAVMCLSGVASNFYGSSLIAEISRALLELRLAVLRVNTRGHDTVSMARSSSGAIRVGAAYEIVDHCRYDVAGWLDFLAGRGYRNIVLLGHSLGAIKILYSQAYEPHPACRCLIGLSPPRLSCAAFQAGEKRDDFAASLQEAQRLLATGNKEQLIQARFPFPTLISAGSYVDKYGPEERYDILKFVPRLRVPILLVYGQQELETGGVAFAGLPDAIRKEQGPGQQLHLATVAGADHMYAGVTKDLIRLVTTWLCEW